MKGFTLVEVLVSVFILGFLVAGVYTVLSVGSIIFREDMNIIQLVQQARQGMESMAKEIRQSNPSQITITGGNTESTFYIRSSDGASWVGPISYYRDVNDLNNDSVTDQILREYPTGTRKILANDISSLSFSVSGNVIEIDIAAQKTVFGRQLCFPAPCQQPLKVFKETIRLRN